MGSIYLRARLKDLRPTQMTVGYEEVALKCREWRAMGAAEARRFLHQHAFPAVRGPKARPFIIDHHHLGRALLEEGVSYVRLELRYQLSHLEKEEFWILMDYHQWVHPYDADGRRRPFSDMPKRLDELANDPFRSLAAAVRRHGDFPKDRAPFAEFVWADFFRRRVSARLVRNDFAKALREAERLARRREAAHLPDRSALDRR